MDAFEQQRTVAIIYTGCLLLNWAGRGGRALKLPSKTRVPAQFSGVLLRKPVLFVRSSHNYGSNDGLRDRFSQLEGAGRASDCMVVEPHLTFYESWGMGRGLKIFA